MASLPPMTNFASQPLVVIDQIDLKDGNRIFFLDEPAEFDPADPPSLVCAISPDDVEFFVPPHFHPLTDEYQRCFAGQLHLTLDGVKVTIRPEDGEIKVAKGVVHSLHSPKGEYAEFGEREDPGPVLKRDFLRQLFEISEKPNPSLLQILTHFYSSGGDAFPAPNHHTKFIGKLMVWIVGGFFGTTLGLGKVHSKDT